MAYKIDSYLCVGCGACFQICKFGAVETVEEEYNCKINPDKCVECGMCVNECPVDIITLDLKEGQEPPKRWTRIWIEESECIGCTKCKRNCPVEAIEGVKKQPFHIDESKCIKCAVCMKLCPKNAVHGQTD